MSPLRKLLLSAWTLLIFCGFFYLLRGMPGRALMPVLLIATLIFGFLLGRRWLVVYDQAKAGSPGPARRDSSSKAPDTKPTGEQFDSFMAFLQKKRAEAQFSVSELKSWCDARGMDYEKILRAAINKKWIHEFNGKMVITSIGERLIESFLSKK